MAEPTSTLSSSQNSRQDFQKHWERFDSLPEVETVQLFSKHLLAMPDERVTDVVERMRARLLLLSNREDRNRLKKDWQNALLNNMEPLSRTSLVVENTERGNTVSTWLRYYLSELGYEPVSVAERQQFLSNAPALHEFSGEERERYDQFIQMLEFTKRDSLTPDGIEETIPLLEDNGKIILIRDGMTTELDERVVKLAEQFLREDQEMASEKHSLKDVFLGPEDERAEIRAIEGRLIASKAVLKDALIEAVRTKRARQAHAVMKLIAQRGALFTALREYPEIGNGVREYIAKRFSQAAQVAFQGALEHPVHLRIALEVLYGDLLGSAPHDAARYAAQIEAVLVKSGLTQYRGMVIANAERAQFEWAPILDEHGELSLVA